MLSTHQDGRAGHRRLAGVAFLRARWIAPLLWSFVARSPQGRWDWRSASGRPPTRIFLRRRRLGRRQTVCHLNLKPTTSAASRARSLATLHRADGTSANLPSRVMPAPELRRHQGSGAGYSPLFAGSDRPHKPKSLKQETLLLRRPERRLPTASPTSALPNEVMTSVL